MRLVTEADIFSKCQSVIDAIITREKRLPEQVFKIPLSHFVFIRADDIFHTPTFFERIKSFLGRVGENRWFLAVVDPDPKDYFYHHFGKYSVVEMAADDTDDDYLRIAQEDPGSSPADAIGFNSHVVLLFSYSGTWAIYGDRGYELGVVGFAEKELQEIFISIYGGDRVFDTTEALEQIVKMVYSTRESGIPLEFQRELIANYGSPKN